ncbi:MAG: hypothetical protein LH474_13260, partial [Chamaesiphon sp.]|nr:hypothetical protein [Chamaesiphon sp.]
YALWRSYFWQSFIIPESPCLPVFSSVLKYYLELRRRLLACPLASVGGLELKLTFCKLTGADILDRSIEPTV